MKQVCLFTAISILGFSACADILYKEQPPVNLWGQSYAIETTHTIILNGNDLYGHIPPEIGDLINLTTLDLSNNQLSGGIPPELANLKNLKHIILSANQLTGFIPHEIGNLINLTTLDLHNNQLSGSVPPEIGNLSHLTKLDLHNNQLSGIIPEVICYIENLSANIANNEFCLPYPVCILDDVGIQDTSACEIPEGYVGIWGQLHSIEYTT